MYQILKYPFLIIGLGVLFFAGAHCYHRYYHRKIHAAPKAYCYQQYWGPKNPVLFVEHSKLIDSLSNYYRKIESGEPNPTFNFPPLSLPMDTCVYVLGYTEDSICAKVACYNWGRQGDFVIGWVYSKTLHPKP